MKRIFRKGWYYLPAACIAWLSCGNPAPAVVADNNNCWRGAGVNQIPVDSAGQEIRYGYELISHTANYLGPAGTVIQVSNGMNCQNCHLEAGTKPWGNNFGGAASLYPKFRNRSGTMETVARRINDCLERSLNGKPIDSNSREMKAMIAYMQWLGSDIAKGTRPKGSGIMQPALLARAADPEKGKIVYNTTCQRCHGSNGEGQPNTTRTGYTYPPLWGANSYNTGAGMYRLSTLAGFVKNNMPDPMNYHAPVLTDEQAWDVAAFINSQPRPSKDISQDWPDISRKPFDHPFGPYADGFSEKQHKYGPFGNMGNK